ncbi:hypothetical protein [Ralstonia mannitolilytica]|uniref:hypothetical protein n=2 Tax=Ralstonia mannitolilytica TaxID=105219 RepID=UPI0026E94436|nr:hypothetical protein [Ralstonia mannitolilytica]
MRDVTDNVTGELAGVEQKRGRGRPRKAHAMTNAERQAAFRARRKAQQSIEVKSVTKRMPVTEILSDIDAYDECRLEVEQLRCELLEEKRLSEIALREMREQRTKAEELARELRQLKAEQRKSVTSNGNPVSFDTMLDLVSMATKANTLKQRLAVVDSKLWMDTFCRDQAVSMEQMQAATAAFLGDRKIVTRKA